MECLLCNFRSDIISVLKEHYADFHGVDPKDYYFSDLFKPDTLDDNKCFKCSLVFKTCRKKKEITCFCFIIISVEVQEMTEEPLLMF